MPERIAKPRSVRRRDVYTEPDGLFGRITDLVIENPVRSGGVVMVVLVIGTIISNAAYFQTAHHPAPLFVTRPAGGDAQSSGTTAPLPRSRSVASTAVGGATPAPPFNPATLVSDTQKALAGLKLYDGPIDGRLGPQTRAAVSAFETKAGLQPTGQPSAALLAQLKRAPRPGDAALPPDAALPLAPAPTEAASSDPASTGSIDPATSAVRIRKVQTALNDIGYGPIRVDGKGGGDTEDAIRRFELDNGLALTGEANDTLVAKLVKIGAMPSS